MSPTDALHVERLVGQLDPVAGTARLTGWVPGPAGLSLVGLAQGEIALAVDRADPSTLVFLEVPHGVPLRRQAVDALEQLLGPGVVAMLSQVGDEPSLVYEGDELARRRATAAGATALGRLAVLRSEVEEQSPTGVDLGLALAELARLARAVDPVLGVAPSHEQLADAAWAGLAGLDHGQLLERLDLEARSAAAAVLDDLLRTSAPDPAWAGEVNSLVALLRPAGPASAGGDRARKAGLLRFGHEDDEPEAEAAEGVQAVRPAVAAAAAPMSSAVVAVEASAPPPPPTDVEVMSRTAAVEVVAVRWEGADLHVQARREPDARELWLRVFEAPAEDEAAPVLLALVPFEGTRFGMDQAVALVDPAVPREPALLVDLTYDPREPAGAPATASFAFELGRRAVRAERLDDPDATELWERCAEAWEQAGDTRRSGLARRRADPEQWRAGGKGRTVPPPVPPFLFDRLAAMAAEDQSSSAKR